jgi:hypothetical protein
MAFGASDKFPDIEVSVRGRDMGHAVEMARFRVPSRVDPGNPFT